MMAHAYKLMKATTGCPHCGKPNGHAENTKGGDPTVAMCLRYLRTRIEELEGADDD